MAIRATRWWWLCLLGCLAGSSPALAQSQSCGGEQVAEDVVRCPDGSIPAFSFGAAPAPEDADAAGLKQRAETNAAFTGTAFGVWHTNRPGIAYQTTSDVPGYTALNILPGVRPGDLTIDPNGSFVWNTTRGMSGKWVAGDKLAPVVLLDVVDGKKWHIQIFDDHIEIYDGKNGFAGRR